MTLQELIEDHRAMMRADFEIPRLVSRQPPTTVDVNTGELFEEPAARVGMAMSGSLMRLLGHPEGYGMAHPWLRSLWLLKGRCRRAHPHHRDISRPYWRGSLCWSLVSFVIVRGFSVDSAAAILRVDREVEQTLTNALHLIEESIDEQRARAEKRAREDAGLAAPVGAVHVHSERHDQGGMHASDCVKCQRAA